MRLNKFIAKCGYCSRRKADELIQAGRVELNGKIVKEMGVQVDPASDTILIQGKKLGAPARFTYLMLNKPTGTISTKADSHAEQTVYDLLPKEFHYLNPVGRLDKTSEGLLLFTDDGDFTYEMTHPKHDHAKTYEIRVKYPPKPADLHRLAKGIDLEEETSKGPQIYRTRPCDIHSGRDAKHFTVTLREGRNRQLRKMFKKIGCPVVYLKRLSQGPYSLGKLPKGQWKLIEKLPPSTP